MTPKSCDHIEIEHVAYPCAKLRRAVVITYLATSPCRRAGAAPCLPELTAFDCSGRHGCGVCVRRGPRSTCRWERCVHPGLAEQEPSTE
jgi:hypothetical protein